jgi:DNA-binding PadR family transcriptional regulator
MTSLVNWALLGLVIERPSYGFEFANRFERVYGGVLLLSGTSQVYSALDALESRELIEIVPGTTTLGRQPRPRYQATEYGLRQYEDRLVEQADTEARRQELWVRQLGIFIRDPGAAIRVLDRFQQRYQKRAGRIGLPTSAIASSGDLVDELVSQQQRHAVGGTLSFLGYARARFEQLANGR